MGKACFSQAWPCESSGGQFQCVVRVVCVLVSGQRTVFCVWLISVKILRGLCTLYVECHGSVC